MRIHFCGKGETLQFLAQKYNVDVNVLASYNQHIKDPSSVIEGMQVTIPSIMGVTDPGMHVNDGKGNVCAYVGEEPVHYNVLHISHWPSQDPSSSMNLHQLQHQHQHHHTMQIPTPPVAPSYSHYPVTPPSHFRDGAAGHNYS